MAPSLAVLQPAASLGRALGAELVCEAASLYRARQPERTTFYELFERHFDQYSYQYEERYEHGSGPLRRVVAKTVQGFLACGRHQGGFARLRCSSCDREHLLAFSCQTRNFCPSCQAKRAALLGERLVTDVLQPVAHRHVVFTIPKALRGLFERKRSLLGILARSAFDATRACLRKQVGKRAASALPGMVSSIQTFGSSANWHPHIHAIASDGLFEPGGTFLAVSSWPTDEIEQHFRRLVLRRLVQAGWLSQAFQESLLSWEHSGFSVHVGEAISASEPEALGRLSRYVARAPVSMKRVFVEPDGSVKYVTEPDPRTGATHVRFAPLVSLDE